VLPTLLELCSLSAGKAQLDGMSLVPLLMKQSIKDRMFVVQYGARQRPIKHDAAVIWKQWRLQKGTELYDIEKDRGQTTDVATRFPDIVARMKAYYEDWWARLDPALNSPIPMLIGTKFQNPVLLTSIDWWEVDADNINFVSQGVGGPRGGIWNIQVESAGKYRIELRRWPFHTNKPIGSEGPRATITGRPLTHKYKLIPAQEAVLSVNGAEQHVALTAESVGATFEVQLAKGIGQLHGWFRDAKGIDLCGAYYALLTKI
jgi:arylsulfatase B